MYDQKNKNNNSPKINFIGFIVLIGILFAIADADPTIFYSTFAIIGSLFALHRRKQALIKREEDSLVKIILNDYLMTRNATLSIISIIYTLIQGACIFLCLSLLIDSIVTAIRYQNFGYTFTHFGWSILVLIGLLVFRLLLEGLTTIIRFGEDFSQFKDDFKKHSKNK